VKLSWFENSRDRLLPWFGTWSWVTDHAGHGSADWWVMWVTHGSKMSPIVSCDHKWDIWPRFSYPVAFHALWFQNEATCRKVETSAWSSGDFSSFWLRHLAHSFPNFDRNSVAVCSISLKHGTFDSLSFIHHYVWNQRVKMLTPSSSVQMSYLRLNWTNFPVPFFRGGGQFYSPPFESWETLADPGEELAMPPNVWQNDSHPLQCSRQRRCLFAARCASVHLGDSFLKNSNSAVANSFRDNK